MKGHVVRKILALGVLAVLLSACTTNVGTAAVVGDSKIPVTMVQESVRAIADQRRAAGPSDNSDIASGQMAQDQLRFHILVLILEQAAARNGVTLLPSELSQARSEVLAQVGGEEQLAAALTQNGIARKDFDSYLTAILFQRKLGEKLVSGDANDRNVSAARTDAVNRLTFETLTATKIVVNPRFGVFDPTSGMLTIKDFTNGALIPRQ